MNEDVLITTKDFDHSKEILKLKGKGIGAIVSFTGVVREIVGNLNLKEMYLEHYPGMTENEIKKIIIKAKNNWPLYNVRVIHRIGTLKLEDNIVFVGVSSAHRQDAFNGANFIMDFLKTEATFWKKENTHRSSIWVKDKEEDNLKKVKWEKN